MLDVTIGSVHYKDNPQDDTEQWKYIDNIFEAALSPWDWQMLKAGYHVRVKENFTAGQIIEFEKQGETVQFQPMALEWTNDLDQIQPIAMPHDVVPIVTNPEVDLLPGMPSHQGTIRWDNAYGQGIDFEWKCSSTRLLKTLEVESFDKLPVPEQYILDGGNPVLRLNLIFDPPAKQDVDILVDGQIWEQSSKAQTFNRIEFIKNGEVLWGFLPLKYWDSSEAEKGHSIATLEKRGNKLYISIRVPYSWLQSATYPIFVDTDVTIDAASSIAQRAAVRGGPFWTSPTVGYVIYVDSSRDLVYQKTTDGGATWDGVVILAALYCFAYDCWADWQTEGDAGTIIHIVGTFSDSDDILYLYLDTSDDSHDTDLIESCQGTGAFRGTPIRTTGGSVSITKSRGGNIAVAIKYLDSDDTFFSSFYTSPDGDNWTSEANPWESTLLDHILLFPGNEIDNQDLWAIFWDASANEISLKTYDDSGNSWSEQSIAGNMNISPNYLQMDGQIRFSDGHLIFSAWNQYNATAADLTAWDINGEGSIVAKTDVVTNAGYGHFLASVFINQGNDDIYVVYAQGAGAEFSVQIVYQLSQDGCANWDGETAMQADAADDERWISAGAVKAAWGGKFQPVWFNDDYNDLFTNSDNGITIEAEAGVEEFFQTVGEGSITPVGALGLFIKIVTGSGAITPTGTLTAIKKFLQTIGEGSVTPTGTLTTIRNIFQSVGSGAITPVGVLNRVIKLLVGEGAIVPTGTLSTVLKFFLSVGQGSITAIGTLNRIIKLTIGSGAITPIGALNRKIMLIVGSGSVTPSGALSTIKKFIRAVGEGVVTPIGTLGRKIMLTVGSGAITPTGALNRLIKLLVGLGVITPTGALSRLLTTKRWLSGYTFRKKIIATGGANTLTNFPMMLYLSTSSGKSSADISHIFDIVPDADRKKIAITTDDETTECYVEIEKWDDGNEKAWLHVKAPSVDSADSDFYFYYGSDTENTDHVGDTNSAAAENVWDANYMMVQHMRDGADTSNIYDSTSNDNDGAKTNANEPNEVAGKVGLAQDFDGNNDKIDLGDIGSLGTTYTVEACVKFDEVVTGGDQIVSYRTDDRADHNNVAIHLDRYQDDARLIVRDNADAIAVATKAAAITSTADWYYLTGIRNGNDISIQVNAGVAATDSQTFGTLYMNRAGIGALYEDAFNAWDSFADAKIDEVRISDIVRDDTWIKMTYDTLWDDLVTWVAGMEAHLSVGSGSITPIGALNRVIKLLVGEGSITPVGTLAGVVKFFQNVGQGAITAVGALGLKIKLAVGAGTITPIGTLNRLIKLLVGSGSITPVGTLAKTLVVKFFVNVGQGAVTIAGALNRKIKLTIGQGAITPVGTLAWGMVRNLILKVNEGNIYRMVVNEGMVYRLKTIAGRIYRLITKEG